ncbi:MAG: amino acid-binding protein [Eubacterium sp.]|nr:amino acid-binding protein [Eubacterium sp.]
MKQVSIFAENVKGAMQSITQTLTDAGINIMGMVTNDSAEYGIIRMAVDKTDDAIAALKEKGYICKSQTVIGVEIEDMPGALNDLLEAIAVSNVNVNYIYISYNRSSTRPIIILHTEDISEVSNCLQGKGFKLV